MNNKRFYIIAGIVLVVVLAFAALLDISSDNQPASGQDQGLRIN